MKVFPVVHINDPDVAVEQAGTAFACGADGVYLIHHGGNPELVAGVFDGLRGRYPNGFVGVNLLGNSTESALRFVHRRGRGNGQFPDALWSDDIRLPTGATSSAMQYKKAYPELSGLLILGGVAFKYTPTYTDDPVVAAREAGELEAYVDVVTTSGAGTGSAPPPEKIRAMKRSVAKPVAVASGITVDNIGDYAGAVDQILVASSVETQPYSGVFAADRLAAFIEAAHSQ